MHANDVQHLFQNFSHAELQDVHRKLRQEVQKKGDEIKELVSQRYRDLIEASDSVALLSKICTQAIQEYQVNTDEEKNVSKVSPETDRMLQIIDKTVFWDMINKKQLIPLANQLHSDELYVSNIPDQNTKKALQCCLARRRKMILVKCWDLIYHVIKDAVHYVTKDAVHHVAKDVNESRTALVVIASITGASLPVLAKNYLKMIETGFWCEPEDEFLLKNLTLRLIRALEYFAPFFNPESFQSIWDESKLNQVPFQNIQKDESNTLQNIQKDESNTLQNIQQNELNIIVKEWTEKVVKLIEAKIDSQLCGIESIDTISSIAIQLDSGWKSLNDEAINVASSVSGSDVNRIKLQFDTRLKEQMKSKIHSQVFTLFAPLQYINSESEKLGSSFLWNSVDNDEELRQKSSLGGSSLCSSVDNDEELRQKSFMYSDDEVVTALNRESKSLLENYRSLYELDTCEVVQAIKNDLNHKLLERINSIVQMYRSENDLNVIFRCNGLLYNSNLPNLFRETWKHAEKLLLNLCLEKSQKVILIPLERLKERLEDDLCSLSCSREVHVISGDKDTKPSWLIDTSIGDKDTKSPQLVDKKSLQLVDKKSLQLVDKKSLQLVDTISGDKGTKASWLPRTISIPLHNFLTGVANEVNDLFGHCLHVDLYPFLWKELREILVTSYADHFSSLLKRSKSVSVRETFAGQAYFDLLFLKQILIPSKDSIKQETPSILPIIKHFESLLDPFDLHLLSNELHTNLINAIQTLSLLLNIILPTTGILSVRGSTEKKGMKKEGMKEEKGSRLETDVQQLNKKSVPEFMLIK